MDSKPFTCELRSGGQTTGISGTITRLSARGDGEVRVWRGLPKRLPAPPLSEQETEAEAVLEESERKAQAPQPFGPPDVVLSPAAGREDVELDLPEPWETTEDTVLYVELDKPRGTRVFMVGVLG